MKRKKVLIIEDNKDLQEIYKIYFKEANFTVFVSDDGMKGLVDLLKVTPDLILLDIMMPHMNGYEVLDTIKKQSSITIPIVVCSNLSQEKDIKKAYDLWADLFIKKSDNSWQEVVRKSLEVLGNS